MLTGLIIVGVLLLFWFAIQAGSEPSYDLKAADRAQAEYAKLPCAKCGEPNSANHICAKYIRGE